MSRPRTFGRLSPVVVLALSSCADHAASIDGGGGNGTPDSAVDANTRDGGGPFAEAPRDGATHTDDTGACAHADVKVSRSPSTVWLAVDNSFDIGQAQTATDVGRPPWQYIRELLLGADGVVPQLQQSIRFGFVAPGMKSDAFVGCAGMMIHVDPERDNAPAIAARYPSEASQENVAAPYYGLVYIRDAVKATPEDQRGNIAVVLGRSAQGEHLCPEDYIQYGQAGELRDVNTSMRLVDGLVSELATLGVKVYVFAASPLATRGDAEGTDREAHLAALGGTGAGPISYTDPAELKQKILNLSFDLVDCTVTLNGQVEDGQGCKGSVSVNGKDLPCDDADGWAVTAPNKVELRGAACSALRAAPEANIQASFPCDVIQLR